MLALENDTTDLYLNFESRIIDMANHDEKSLVRAAAISVLATKDKQKYQSVFKEHLFDSSYAAAGNALYAYLQTQAEDIPLILDSLKNERNFSITSSMADYFIMNQDYSKYPWFEEKLYYYSGSDLWYFIKLFGMYLIAAPPELAQQGMRPQRMRLKLILVPVLR